MGTLISYTSWHLQTLTLQMLLPYRLSGVVATATSRRLVASNERTLTEMCRFYWNYSLKHESEFKIIFGKIRLVI